MSLSLYTIQSGISRAVLENVLVMTEVSSAGTLRALPAAIGYRCLALFLLLYTGATSLLCVPGRARRIWHICGGELSGANVRRMIVATALSVGLFVLRIGVAGLCILCPEIFLGAFRLHDVLLKVALWRRLQFFEFSSAAVLRGDQAFRWKLAESCARFCRMDVDATNRLDFLHNILPAAFEEVTGRGAEECGFDFGRSRNGMDVFFFQLLPFLRREVRALCDESLFSRAEIEEQGGDVYYAVIDRSLWRMILARDEALIRFAAMQGKEIEPLLVATTALTQEENRFFPYYLCGRDEVLRERFPELGLPLRSPAVIRAFTAIVEFRGELLERQLPQFSRILQKTFVPD